MCVFYFSRYKIEIALENVTESQGPKSLRKEKQYR